MLPIPDLESLKLKLKFKPKIRSEMSSRYCICTKISLTYSTSIESVQAQLQPRVGNVMIVRSSSSQIEMAG
jgi:hypothetical protein